MKKHTENCRVSRRDFIAGVALASAVAPVRAQRASVSAKPDTPFKLATFETRGRSTVGMVLGDRLLDIAGANAYVTKQAGLAAVGIPTEMRELIEQYGAVSSRLYQIANFLKGGKLDGLPFSQAVDQAAIKAPISYPWNVLCIAANYRAHAEGMGDATRPSAGGQPQGQPAGGRGGFNAAAAAEIQPDRDAPIFFAKSPRSCIVGTGDAYIIPRGRDRMDWEGELAVVIGKPASMVPKEQAHDYVFGYSIMYDVSDRGGRQRVVSMFPGTNWFDGKSTDRAAPFGPFIVPREFLPNHQNLRILTKVNGVVKQDGNTGDMIWDEAHQIAFLTSILSLHPGDVISTGTPSGTGAERGEFLKPGDVVTIEIEGIGVLRTPMKASSV